MEIFVINQVREVENKYWWFKARREILIPLVEKYLKPKSIILDAGCGTGFISEKLKENFDVHLVDSSEEAVRIANQKGFSAERASLANLPFPDAYFDAVCAFDVLYHKQVEIVPALREINRVLKPGGYVITSEPAYEWLRGKGNIADHAARRFTSEQLCGILKERGFKIEQAGYFNTFLFPFIALARMAQSVKRFFVRTQNVSTEFSKLPTIINQILTSIFSLEKNAVAKGGFPFGVSVFCVAKK